MTVPVENLRRTADFMKQASGVDPTWLRQAADEIEGLRREILRCDDACYGRDKEIAELQKSLRIAREALERIKYGNTHVDAIAEEALEKLSSRVSPS